jgi:hypothetical protein
VCVWGGGAEVYVCVEYAKEVAVYVIFFLLWAGPGSEGRLLQLDNCRSGKLSIYHAIPPGS